MTDIQELFSRDPLQLTQPDISAIVEHYRAARKQFKTAEAQGKRPTASAKRTAKPALPPVDLDDLFK